MNMESISQCKKYLEGIILKINAHNVDIHTFLNGSVTIAFDCSSISRAHLNDLKSGEDYFIEIKNVRKSRTLNQNALLWELIGQICEAENGNKAETEDIYIQLIEESGASVDFLMTLPECEEDLKKVFRVVKAVDKREYKGKEMIIFKCFVGSSNFDTKQMSILIDKTIERAERDGLEIEYYKEQFQEIEKKEGNKK